MKLRWLFLLFLLVAVICTGSVFVLLSQPYARFATPIYVEIPKGTGTKGVARILEREGVIRSRWLLLAARALRPASSVKAGEYEFSRPASVWEVSDRLARGDVYFVELTVPEGSNIFDIAALVAPLGTIQPADFLKCAADPAPIRDLAPRAPSLEGYLFPATYRLGRKTSAKDLCLEMTNRFRKVWHDLKARYTLPAELPDVHSVVTLASLVEKEAAVSKDRPLVASVFRNRLRLRMTLDCDPTAIYAALLEDRYRGTIYRSDLQSKNLYNTYQHPGLPPGPIANPGVASLEAVLAPAQTDYLYFVARPDGSGSHQFSSNLSDHNRAVAEYRRGTR
jgi:UPF0755 protein